MPHRVESFEKVDSSGHQRARPGFVKSIQNGLRKVQNLIQSRPSRVKTDLTGRENGIKLQKEK